MTPKGRHLTLDNRHYIEDALNDHYSLVEIAKYLGKDPTTISKEVKRNRMTYGKSIDSDLLNCQNQKSCKRIHICSDTCDHLCKKCPTQNCYRICPDYVPKSCTQLMRFPHVCNGCTRKTGCKLQKFRYRAKVAQTNYTESLKTPRKGISLSPNELSELDALISPLVLKGQSLAHIYAHHKLDIKCSKRTLYAYFEQHLFTARNIDLPRKVKYKPRKKSVQKLDRSTVHRLDRNYEDFNRFIANHPEKHVVEMDTVHGTKGSKSLLTLFFRNSSLMLAFLLDACTQEAVNQVFDKLYTNLGLKVFQKTFPVILTDNGSEFKAPKTLEFDTEGNRRTHLFFCDPMASHQKACIEKNHSFIRYILPKGKSFEDLTQEKVTRIMNHINSTARASLNGNTPFKLAQLLVDDSLLESCFLHHIPADDIHLKPALIKV